MAKLLLKRLCWISAASSSHNGSSFSFSHSSRDLCSSVTAQNVRKLGACPPTEELNRASSYAGAMRRRFSVTAHKCFGMLQNKNQSFHEIITSAFDCPPIYANDTAIVTTAAAGTAAAAAIRMGRGGSTTRRQKKRSKRTTGERVWISFIQIFMPEYRTANRNKIRRGGLLKRVKAFLALVLSGKEEENAGGGGGIALVDNDYHLHIKYRPGELLYRIQKELKNFISSPPTGCSVDVSKNMKVWIITITGPKGSVYEGGRFRLRVSFPSNYPAQPPSVYFLQNPPPPKHEHVYTNGDICLSLLGKDWKPNLTISGLTISIVSMLSSAAEKRCPQDNAAHANVKPGGPQTNWVYHDQRA